MTAGVREDAGEASFLPGDGIAIGADGRPTLTGSECAECGARVYPAAAVCHACMSENLRPLALSTAGTLYSWSVVHIAPKGWNTPYIAAYVDLPEGVRVFTHIVEADPARLVMDMRVRLCTAVLGTGEDGRPMASYAFTPA